MKRIAVFDPSICSINLGDLIIKESVLRELRIIFSDFFFVHIPTQENISKISYGIVNDSDFKIIAGTNLLSSRMNDYRQWQIGLRDSLKLNNIILFGVGWWQYQENPNHYTSFVLNKVLSRKYWHSVRDNYTKAKLNSIGINNVLNTGCPTMWGLTEEFCSTIPIDKAENAIFTITDYKQDYKNDIELIKILKSNYKCVFFWPQGMNDYEYYKSFEPSVTRGITEIKPSVEDFYGLLQSNISLDFIGTRLHGGVAALNCRKRTIIIGVDNRSVEISKDFGLKVIPREEMQNLATEINQKFYTKIKIPKADIDNWRSQFEMK